MSGKIGVHLNIYQIVLYLYSKFRKDWPGLLFILFFNLQYFQTSKLNRRIRFMVKMSLGLNENDNFIEKHF